MKIKFKNVILSSIIVFSLVSPIFNTVSKAADNDRCCKRATSARKNNKRERDNKEEGPKLIKVEQISPKIIEITYDRPVDISNALCLRNYWIQSLDKETPNNIATLGKNDKIDDSNSLRRKNVKITPKDDKNMVFELQFNSEISPGENYKFMASFIKAEGVIPYIGSNGEIEFVGK